MLSIIEVEKIKAEISGNPTFIRGLNFGWILNSSIVKFISEVLRVLSVEVFAEEFIFTGVFFQKEILPERERGVINEQIIIYVDINFKDKYNIYKSHNK